MKTLENKIELSKRSSEKNIEKLNVLLSDFQVYYMNLRGLHWNVKGRDFFLLHEKFEELYTEAGEDVDEIAERILSLGATPLHTLENYLANQRIRTIENVSDGRTAVQLVMDNLELLLLQEREILDTASDLDDEGTAALMSDLISRQEKLSWMLKAYLS